MRRNDPEDVAVAKAYLLGCGAMAELLTRRAFATVADGCQWYQAVFSGPPDITQCLLGVDQESAKFIAVEAKTELAGVDEATWGRILLICSTQKDTAFDQGIFDWREEPWLANRPELLELICAAPYHPCKSLDELVRRYAHGLLGAALGCQVTFESDRMEAVTGVVRAIAWRKFDVDLGAEELLSRVWQIVLTDEEDFGVVKVNAPIVSGSSSVALGPLQLHGTQITYSTNSTFHLKCHYKTADGSVVDFDGAECIAIDVVLAAGVVRGIVRAESCRGLPDKPMPKLQHAATGVEVDICLCVPRAEAFATIAKKVVFTLLTQPFEEGNRVISLRAAMFPLSGNCIDGASFCLEKPPSPDICFYDNKG